MAVWTASAHNLTVASVADTTGFTANAYLAIQGGSSTQRINILETFISGFAAASTPMTTLLARHSTVSTSTQSGGFNAAQDPATAALAAPPVVFTTTSGTQPQRSSTLHLDNLGFNCFGGIIRHQYNPDKPIAMLGNTASFGELSVSQGANGNSGSASIHIFYEPL